MYTKLNNLIIFNLIAKKGYSYIVNYPSPINLNYLWNFGFMAAAFLGIQILSGFFLTLFYIPQVDLAFASVQFIMRDINYGWMIRYFHLNSASFFFIIIYIHILKGIYYGSYRYPRIGVWYTGIIIYLLMMGSAFLGYVLPWGQMSYWAATVITNFITVIPIIGKSFVYWVWGGFSINAQTLTRFFSLHYILPFILAVFALYHIYLLHTPGSSNSLGVSSGKLNKINFFPYYVIKDLFGLSFIFIFYISFICFTPEALNHSDNYIEANPMVTPPHIVPEWYFLPFYGVLKTILSKLYGVVMMLLSILVFFLLPFLDISRIKGNFFKQTSQLEFWGFVFNFFLLGYIGLQLPIYPFLQLGTVCTHMHFAFFFLCIPMSGFYEYDRNSNF